MIIRCLEELKNEIIINKVHQYNLHRVEVFTTKENEKTSYKKLKLTYFDRGLDQKRVIEFENTHNFSLINELCKTIEEIRKINWKLGYIDLITICDALLEKELKECFRKIK